MVRSRTGTWRSLRSLLGDFSRATAINEYGHVVGYSSTLGAFIWMGGTDVRGLKELGYAGSRAYGVNDLRQVVGYYDTETRSVGFVWTPGSVPAAASMQRSGTRSAEMIAAGGITVDAPLRSTAIGAGPRREEWRRRHRAATKPHEYR
jgi:hypothetical protein